MLSVDLAEQALQHERNVVLLVVTVNQPDSILERRDGELDVVLRVLLVAVDLAQLVENGASVAFKLGNRCLVLLQTVRVSVLAARVDLFLDDSTDTLVHFDCLGVQILLFKLVTKLF